MAAGEEVVDSIALAARFDDSDLQRQTQASLSAIRAFTDQARSLGQNIPPIQIRTDVSAIERTRSALRQIGDTVRALGNVDTPEIRIIDTPKIRAQLEEAGVNVEAFFAGVRSEAASAAAALSALEAAIASPGQLDPRNVATLRELGQTAGLTADQIDALLVELNQVSNAAEQLAPERSGISNMAEEITESAGATRQFTGLIGDASSAGQELLNTVEQVAEAAVDATDRLTPFGRNLAQSATSARDVGAAVLATATHSGQAAVAAGQQAQAMGKVADESDRARQMAEASARAIDASLNRKKGGKEARDAVSDEQLQARAIAEHAERERQLSLELGNVTQKTFEQRRQAELAVGATRKMGETFQLTAEQLARLDAAFARSKSVIQFTPLTGHTLPNDPAAERASTPRPGPDPTFDDMQRFERADKLRLAAQQVRLQLLEQEKQATAQLSLALDQATQNTEGAAVQAERERDALTQAAASAQSLQNAESQRAPPIAAAGGGAPPPPPPPPVPPNVIESYKLLADQLRQVPILAEDAASSMSHWSSALDSAGKAGKRTIEGNAAFQRGLDNIAKANAAATQGFIVSSRSMGLLRSSLVTLATQALGTESAVGRLAQSVLFLAGGATAVLVIAGTVLVLTKAYELLTAGIRAAKKEQEDLVKAGREAGNAVGAGAAREQQMGALRKDIKDNTEKEKRLQDAMIPGWLRMILIDQTRTKIQQDRYALLALEVQKQEELRVASLDVAQQSVQDQANLARQTLQNRENEARRRIELERAVGRASIEDEREFFRQRAQLAQQQGAAEVAALREQRANLIERPPDAIDTAAVARHQGEIDSLDAQIIARERQTAEIRRQIAEEERLFLIEQQRQALQNQITDAQARAATVQSNFGRATARFNEPTSPTGGIDEGTARSHAIADLREEAAELRRLQAAAESSAAGMEKGSAAARALAAQGRQLGDLARNLTDAADQADRFPDLGGVIGKAFEGAQARLPQIEAGFELLNRQLIEQDAVWARIQKDVDQTLTPLQKLQQSEGELVDNLGGIIGAVSNLGDLGDEASRAAGHMLELADAVFKVVTATSATLGGSIAGLVGAGIGIVGGLFGNSGPSETDRILEETNRRLEELKVSLDRSIETNQGLAQAQAAAVSAAAAAIPRGGALSDLGVGQRVLDALNEAGLSVAEFAKIVKDQTGLDILDSEGRLLTDTLGRAREALELVIEDMTTFGDSLTEQTAAADLRSRIAGEEQGAAPDFQRELGVILGQNLSPAIARAFANVDPTDLDSVQKALLELFDAFDNKQLSATDIGKLTKDEWIKFLEDGAGALEEMRDAAKDAANQLGDINLPPGFKRQLDAFQASEFGFPATGGNDGAALPVPEKPSVDPGRLDNEQFISRLDRLAQETPPDLLGTVRALSDVTAGRLDHLAQETPPDLLGMMQELIDATAARRGDGGPPATSAAATATSNQPTIGTLQVNVSVNGQPASATLQADVQRAVEEAVRQMNLKLYGNYGFPGEG